MDVINSLVLDTHVMQRLRRLQKSITWRLILGICWHLLHVLVSIVHFVSYIIKLLQLYLISSGLLQKYQVLPLEKLKYLAIVVDGEEAKDITKIGKLLRWLSGTCVRRIILYDMEGVLKKHETSLKEWVNSSMKSSDPEVWDSSSLPDQVKMSLEFLSSTDGKEGVAKAASFLCSKYLTGNGLTGDQREPVITEDDVSDALRVVGCGGPEPDLLLVFAPTRCHLGFPAWRIRYTEIVHMGTLKSTTYSAVVKAIHDLSGKHQNYGS